MFPCGQFQQTFCEWALRRAQRWLFTKNGIAVPSTAGVKTAISAHEAYPVWSRLLSMDKISCVIQNDDVPEHEHQIQSVHPLQSSKIPSLWFGLKNQGSFRSDRISFTSDGPFDPYRHTHHRSHPNNPIHHAHLGVPCHDHARSTSQKALRDNSEGSTKKGNENRSSLDYVGFSRC